VFGYLLLQYGEEDKIFSDEEVFEQIKPASRKAYKKCWKEFKEIGWSGRGAARRPWKAAAGPPAGRGERPGAVRWPWRATWGRPPAVESGLGPSAGRGERPGAVRRPWRAAWGRPQAVESGLGPSAGRGERPRLGGFEALSQDPVVEVEVEMEKDPLDTNEYFVLEEDPEMYAMAGI
jgi:hypothetical protein